MVRIVLILLYIGYLHPICAQKYNTEKAGDIIQIFLPVSAFSSTFIFDKTNTSSWEFMKTMGASFILTHSLKVTLNKPRPNGGNFSFPSGHTSAAFTGAAFIERKYGWAYGGASYILASYVGWSRVNANKHDYWDVFGGILIGVGSAYFFTQEQKNLNITISHYEKNPALTLCITL